MKKNFSSFCSSDESDEESEHENQRSADDGCHSDKCEVSDVEDNESESRTEVKNNKCVENETKDKCFNETESEHRPEKVDFHAGNGNFSQKTDSCEVKGDKTVDVGLDKLTLEDGSKLKEQ